MVEDLLAATTQLPWPPIRARRLRNYCFELRIFVPRTETVEAIEATVKGRI